MEQRLDKLLQFILFCHLECCIYITIWVMLCYVIPYVHYILPSHHIRLDKNAEAIVVLRGACEYDTRNSMLYFQLAHVLLKNGSEECLEEALRALYVVREYAPREPPVYSTLGEVREKEY
jgi:predicted Zn-dependent protease